MYYAISALPLMGNKWGMASFYFGEDLYLTRARALCPANCDHAHVPVVLSAGPLPLELRTILKLVSAAKHEEIEARLSRCAYVTEHAENLAEAAHDCEIFDVSSTRCLSVEQIFRMTQFITEQTHMGQELLAGRDFALR